MSYTSRNKNPKNLIFSQKKDVLPFQETEAPKKFFINQEVTFRTQKSKHFYTLPYKEAKISKLKCSFTIITKHFFLSYNIFFYTQQTSFCFSLSERFF